MAREDGCACRSVDRTELWLHVDTGLRSKQVLTCGRRAFVLGLSALILIVYDLESVLKVKSKLRLSCKWEAFDLRMYELL